MPMRMAKVKFISRMRGSQSDPTHALSPVGPRARAHNMRYTRRHALAYALARLARSLAYGQALP